MLSRPSCFSKRSSISSSSCSSNSICCSCCWSCGLCPFTIWTSIFASPPSSPRDTRRARMPSTDGRRLPCGEARDLSPSTDGRRQPSGDERDLSPSTDGRRCIPCNVLACSKVRVRVNTGTEASCDPTALHIQHTVR
eukprot:scaffold4146_cov63-Phaeocystis_antarctica.AAC.7